MQLGLVSRQPTHKDVEVQGRVVHPAFGHPTMPLIPVPLRSSPGLPGFLRSDLPVTPLKNLTPPQADEVFANRQN